MRSYPPIAFSKFRQLICLLISLVLLSIWAAGTLAHVSAAAAREGEPEVIAFEQLDLDGDATPDKAIITASYFDQLFRVNIYDQGNDMQPSDDWRTGTDFVNDIWIFHNGVDEATKLIIRFSHDLGGYTAELYDDVNEDGNVSHLIRDRGQVEIRESSFPTVRFEAQQPWTLPGGMPNYLVHITAFRPLHLAAADPAIGYYPPDGRPAYEQETVDLNADGIPDYELLRYFPDVPPEWGLFRASLNVNIGNTPLPGFTGALFWPYLGTIQDFEGRQSDARPKKPGGLNQDKPPLIRVDWGNGKIMAVAGFLPAWGIGDQWKIQSSIPIEKNVLNELDWEGWAYYSFAGTSYPNLVVLKREGFKGESVRIGSELRHPQQVTITWHHNNIGTLKWDYKLGMAGLHEFPTTEVVFEDFSLRELPYEDWARKFTDQDWAYATFVAAEERKTASSEGIVEWGTLHGVIVDVSLPPDDQFLADTHQAQRGYLLGRANVSPAEYYADIRPGFRGEYGDIQGPARLYFSPIDRKLHLLKAQKGVWNLETMGEIRYANLGGDHLNHWNLLEDGKALKNLFFVSGYVIYGGEDKLQITRTETPAAIFTTLPPRDQEEWLKLGRNLEQHKPAFAPDDFAAMIAQFEGPSASTIGGSLRDLRLTEHGFRFVLDLALGFVLNRGDLLAVHDLNPGSYVVSYDGDFRIRPLTPLKLSLSLPSFSAAPEPFTAYVPAQLRYQLTNTGLEDANHVVVTASISADEQDASSTMTQTVRVLAQETTPVYFDWTPTGAGSWSVQLEAVALGVPVDRAVLDHELLVLSAEDPSFWETLSAFGLVPPLAVLLFLFASALFGGALLLVGLRSVSAASSDPQDPASSAYGPSSRNIR